MKKYILAGLFVATLLGGVGWLRRIGVPDGPSSDVQPRRQSPMDERLARPPARIVAAEGETVRTRVADSVKAADKVSTKELAGNDWAVVVAIYKEFDAAERRASRINQGSAFRAIVFPSQGQGSKYMVVVEDGLTHGKATQLREQGVAQGLPADSYVTRLSARP